MNSLLQLVTGISLAQTVIAIRCVWLNRKISNCNLNFYFVNLYSFALLRLRTNVNLDICERTAYVCQLTWHCDDTLPARSTVHNRTTTVVLVSFAKWFGFLNSQKPPAKNLYGYVNQHQTAPDCTCRFTENNNEKIGFVHL